MYTLGLSFDYHDAAVALVSDKGEILCAIEEERLSRYKHDSRLPRHAIEECLRDFNIQPEHLNAVVFFENTENKFWNLIRNLPRIYLHDSGFAKHILREWFSRKLHTRSRIKDAINLESEKKIHFSNHHFSHSSAAYLTFSEATSASLTIDGVGESESMTFGLWTDGKYRKIAPSITYPHSIGLMYTAFTEFLGFEVNEGEYKVMGLAAYGQPKYLEKISKLAEYGPGSFVLNLDYFSFHNTNKGNLSLMFTKEFGPSRIPESDFYIEKFRDELDIKELSARPPHDTNQSQYYADIAASLQEYIWRVVKEQVRFIVGKTGSKNLVYGGGVAYNSVINGRILREKLVDKLHIFPAAGDSGSAVGAALAYNLKGGYEINGSASPYLGVCFDDQLVEREIIRAGLIYEKIFAREELAEDAANELASGRVIGWFQGRAEFGPRALGSRSILADPRSLEMKIRVNKSVKFREVFRPFAPVVLKEYAKEFFELSDDEVESSIYKYMLGVAPVRYDKQDKLKAVTHVDGTARVQILEKNDNLLLHQLISSFRRITDVPVILNTSFNRRGEPMVYSPYDALLTFGWSGLDVLYIGSYKVSKKWGRKY